MIQEAKKATTVRVRETSFSTLPTVKPEKGRLMKLEAIRGFAALYVAVGHTFSKDMKFGNIDFSFLFGFGQEAVILFFFLSGFVIQYTFQKSKDKSFKVYFMKRFLRIYIPLVLIFGLNYVVQLLQSPTAVTFDFLNLGINLLMLQDISALKPNVVGETFMGNSPLWSLSYEWWFYMLFFFAVQKFNSKASAVIYSCGIVAALTYLAYPFFVNRIFMYLVIWWVGADMARLYLQQKTLNLKNLRRPIFSICAIVFILAMNAVINKERIYEQLHVKGIGISPMLELRHFAFALVAIGGALLWHRLQWRFFSRTVGLFTPLAPVSFALYISHYFLVSTASYLDFIPNAALRYGGYFFICYALSYLIERIIYVHLNRMIFASPLFAKNRIR